MPTRRTPIVQNAQIAALTISSFKYAPPTELRSSSENERAFRRGSGGGSERGSTRDEDGRVGGMVSPLPFESSLAPDFLALFANNWTPGMD